MFAALLPILLANGAAAELTPDQVQEAVTQFTSANLTNIVPINDIVGLVQGNWGTVDFSKAGYAFTTGQANAFPDTLTINPAPGKKAENVPYTAMLVDAGRAGQPDTPKLHWLINNIHLNDTDKAGGPYVLNYSDGTTVKQYAAPGPQDEGAHRYVFAVFNQGGDFTPPAGYQNADEVAQVSDFNLQKYITDSKIGGVIGANYFTVDANDKTGNATAATAGAAGANGANGTGNGNGTAGGAGGNSTVGGAGAGQGGNGTDGGAGGNSTSGGAGGQGGNGTDGNGNNGGAGGQGGTQTGSANPGASSAPGGSGDNKDSGAGSVAPAVGLALAAGALAALF